MKRRMSTLLLGSISLLALSTPVWAASDSIEEVVVTASKRAEPLKDVPLAVSVIGQDQLDHLNARSYEDFINNVPGMSITEARDAIAAAYIAPEEILKPGKERISVTLGYPAQQCVQVAGRRRPVFSGQSPHHVVARDDPPVAPSSRARDGAPLVVQAQGRSPGRGLRGDREPAAGVTQARRPQPDLHLGSSVTREA